MPEPIESATPSSVAPSSATPPSTAPTPEPTTTSESPKTPDQPASQPSDQGRFVTNQELERYGRYQQQAEGSRRFYDEAKQHGFADISSAIEAAATFSKMKNDPQKGRILEAILNDVAEAEDRSQGNPEPNGKNAELTVEQLVDARLTQYREAEARRSWEAAKTTQDNMIGEVLKSPQFKGMFGEHDFDSALDGKAGEGAQAMAAMMDSFFYAAGQDENGNLQPIASPERFKEVMGNVLKGVNAIKAYTIMEASGNLGDPNPAHSVSDAPDTPAYADRDAKKQANIDFFNAQLRKYSAEGSPASQL
jgi:hypothetical protein